MNYTDNLNLKKPEQTEFYDVDDFNANADLLDDEIQKIKDDYLPLSGGTMTGDIVTNHAIKNQLDNSYITTYGGTGYMNGAQSTLYGKSHAEKGAFRIIAHDGTVSSEIKGTADGALTWKNDNVVRSIGGVKADKNGNVNMGKLITSSNDLKNLPVGDYFFSGYFPIGDTDTVLAGTDFSGVSLYQKGQAVQMVFQGKKIFYRMDDDAVVNVAPNYSEWIEFITKTNVATTTEYGLVKLADDTVAINEDATDAAITPAVYHDVSDFRHKNTAYVVGDKVECMFNFELFLECTQAGTTGANPLDTRNVTHGQVITDGTVKWTVRTHIRSVNGEVAGADGNVNVPQISKSEIVNIVYPVGSLYWSSKPTSPQTLFGGTWVQIKDKFILAAGDTYSAGSTGGEASHTLTVAEMPAHNHTGSAASAGEHTHDWYSGKYGSDSHSTSADAAGNGSLGYKHITYPAGAHSHTVSINSTGGNSAHNNMPPYVVKYCWERTA